MKKKSYYFGDKALIRRQASRSGVGDNRERGRAKFSQGSALERSGKLGWLENHVGKKRGLFLWKERFVGLSLIKSLVILQIISVCSNMHTLYYTFTPAKPFLLPTLPLFILC